MFNNGEEDVFRNLKSDPFEDSYDEVEDAEDDDFDEDTDDDDPIEITGDPSVIPGWDSPLGDDENPDDGEARTVKRG